MTDEHRTVSRPGTARALVLVASALALGGAALTCLVTLVFGPALLDEHGLTGSVVWATVAFCGVVLIAVIAANVLAARGKTITSVVARGCGTLLGGVLVGVAVLLLLVSRTA